MAVHMYYILFLPALDLARANRYPLCLQLSEKYEEFVTPSEKEEFMAKLQEVEDWLYEDGEDETKGVYIAKLEELKKVSVFVPELLTSPSFVFIF